VAAALELAHLSKRFGGLPATKDVSLTVTPGERRLIIGPNGAGKTTLFKAISGTVQPSAGRILFEDKDLIAVAPPERAHLGIAHVPEGRQVFGSMTVMENLEMGAYPQTGRAAWNRNLERIFALFPVLAERRDQAAGTLSGGEQQMLAIGRGIASSPRLLMLDEPSMGLAPVVADLIFERIGELHRDGLAILLVEQRVAEAVQSCDFGYVMEAGRVVLEGTHQTLLADDRIRSVYLGL